MINDNTKFLLYCTVVQYGDVSNFISFKRYSVLPTYLVVTNLIPSLFCTHEKVGASFLYSLFLIAMFHLVQKLDGKNLFPDVSRISLNLNVVYDFV